jgi:hypothetical protein
MSTANKTSWADDVEEFEQPKIEQDFVDENGIRTTIEYVVNEEGKKVKVCVHLDSSSLLQIFISLRSQERSSELFKNRL